MDHKKRNSLSKRAPARWGKSVAFVVLLMAFLLVMWQIVRFTMVKSETGRYSNGTSVLSEPLPVELVSRVEPPPMLVSGATPVDNGFEPDDGEPVPSLEEQVRNQQVVARVEFSEEDISISRFGEYDVVSVENALSGMGEPGSPDLPLYTVSLLIPRGRVMEDIRFNVSEVSWKQNVKVFPTQLPSATDGSTPPAFVEPDESVYSRSEFLPAVVAQGGSDQRIRGYTVIPVHVSPVRYNPASGELTRVTSLKIELSTRDMTQDELQNAFMPKSNEHFDRSVKALVSNPGIMDIQIEDW